MWNRLTCVTPADPVVDVAAAKEHLRVDHPDQDDMIEALVAAAQATIEGPTGIGVAIGPSSWRLSLDAFPAEIRIPLGPVRAISAITYVDASGGVQTLDAANYTADLDARPARIAPAFGKAWPATRETLGAVKILFSAGPDVPAKDLVHAIKLLVGHYYANPEAVAANTLMKLPLGVEALLARHAAPAI
jgi:uncharacterized phiE125 gp8 family phage protein